MSESTHLHSSSPTHDHSDRRPTKTTASSWRLLFFTLILPIALASILFRLDSFQPAHLPADVMSRSVLTAPALNDKMRGGSKAVAEGHVEGPEDLVYDAATGVIYTGCKDGWIKRVTLKESVADSVVESLVRTEGRPLGVSLDRNGELIVADSDKGLVKVTREGKIELLTDEVEGLKFKLTDGVDVAEDGTIYLTDFSDKYNANDSFLLDVLEGKPRGRLMSFDPSTNHTALLASNLYTPNGVAVSPDQQSLVFCETIARRCRKYYIKGPKKGNIEKFVDDMPGLTDNIHYDGEGHYWIALSASYSLELTLRCPVIRKAMAMIVKYVGKPNKERNNAGVVAVDSEGKLKAHYYDAHFSMISSGIKIGNHLYCGSVHYPFIIRLDLNKYPVKLHA